MPFTGIKSSEKFWVHMNNILRDWKILQAPSEKTYLYIDHFGNAKVSKIVHPKLRSVKKRDLV